MAEGERLRAMTCSTTKEWPHRALVHMYMISLNVGVICLLVRAMQWLSQCGQRVLMRILDAHADSCLDPTRAAGVARANAGFVDVTRKGARAHEQFISGMSLYSSMKLSCSQGWYVIVYRSIQLECV
jgi:hypothetical protein